MKRLWSLIFAAALLLSLCACSSSDKGAVFVQSVAQLSNMGGIAPGDRFAGVVVSENVAQIKKDEGKTVAELLVKEGDDVVEGQELFRYDTDQLQLELDRKTLELDQLKLSIENYKSQITELEAERSRAGSDKQLEYTVQIQTVELDLKEAELNLKAKQTELGQAKAILENAAVVAPVSGRVQSISENGYDNYGNPLPYISIQQTGAFRIKGILGELQQSALMVGSRIRVISRTDESQVWYGTIAMIDYESPSQGGQYDMYYGMPADEMTSSSNYPFYVELDETDGLLLGQHVYMEVDTGEQAFTGVTLGSYFICYDDDGSTYVWAENRNKLEKRIITLGEYDPMMDTFQILSGLSDSDYIAFPDPELCQEGAPTTHSAENDQAVQGDMIVTQTLEGGVM